ncbi:hypothetical protein Dimus_003762 [Dionaea muscipula]
MSVTHLRKKDVVKSEVRGVDLEFDNEKLATILGVHSENGICEYIEEVWEESKYTKPLEITGRFANDATDHEGGKSAVGRDETFSKVMMRHMSYVISVKDHELPYGDWLALVFEAFGVPLVIKKEKNQRNMISLKTPSSPCVADRGRWDMVDRKW